MYPVENTADYQSKSYIIDHKLLDDENDYFRFESELLSLLQAQDDEIHEVSLQQPSLRSRAEAFHGISKHLCGICHFGGWR